MLLLLLLLPLLWLRRWRRRRWRLQAGRQGQLVLLGTPRLVLGGRGPRLRPLLLLG